MAKPLLNGSRVMAMMRQLEAAGMTQRVRVNREGELGTTDRPSLAARDAGRLR